MRVVWTVIAISMLLLAGGCQGGAQEGEGYQMPEPTEENLEWVRDWTRKHLVYVEGGTFMMGDQGLPDSLGGGAWTSDTDDTPAHEVRLTSYSIQRYEVTYWEYDLYSQMTGRTVADSSGLAHLQKTGEYLRRKGNRPAGVPTWQAAWDYCRWAGKQIGVEMDLPTEAQWEYAARSRGKNVAVATKDGMPRPGENMIESMDVQPIGTYPPNPLGLHNMSDNVREWTRDWYREDWYKKQKSRPTVPVDPTGPESGEKKVMRGGGTPYDTERMTRLYRRMPRDPGVRDTYPTAYGFRCVAERDQPIEGPEE